MQTADLFVPGKNLYLLLMSLKNPVFDVRLHFAMSVYDIAIFRHIAVSSRVHISHRLAIYEKHT